MENADYSARDVREFEKKLLADKLLMEREGSEALERLNTLWRLGMEAEAADEVVEAERSSVALTKEDLVVPPRRPNLAERIMANAEKLSGRLLTESWKRYNLLHARAIVSSLSHRL